MNIPLTNVLSPPSRSTLMVVHEVEQRVIHRLPVAIHGVYAEMRRRVGQPTCTGTFPLYWVRAEEAVHLMFNAVHRHALMRRVVRFLLPVAAVFPMLLFLLMPFVLPMPFMLIFLRSILFFHIGRGMFVAVVLTSLPRLVLL